MELIFVLFTPRGKPFQFFVVDGPRIEMYDFGDPCRYYPGYHYNLSASGLGFGDLYAETSRGCYWIKPGIKARGTIGLVRLKALPRTIFDAAALFALGHEGMHLRCSRRENDL